MLRVSYQLTLIDLPGRNAANGEEYSVFVHLQFCKMKKYQVWVLMVLLYTSALFIFACNQYYKVTPRAYHNVQEKSTEIDSLRNANRYFILRNGADAYALSGISLSQDNQTLQAKLDTIPKDLTYHLGNKDRTRTSPVSKNTPLNQVHLFIDFDSTITYNTNSLALSKVKKIEIIEHDQRRTANASIGTGAAIVGGTLLLVGIIALATKSSCPFVSAYDGEGFSLQGEIYGGAIYPQLARNDYLPLKMRPLPDGSLQVKISNELKERQYTDMAHLWVITHRHNTQVFADEHGALHEVALSEKPVYAKLNEKKDVLESVSNANDDKLTLMDDSSRIDGVNDLVLRFKRTSNDTTALLLLTAKNSYFLDMLYGKIAQGLGTYYTSYVQEQKTKSAALLQQWIAEQKLPLQVSVKTGKSWAPVTMLPTIGPLASRQMLVPIPLPKAGSEEVEIKLSCGFYFWEIDEVKLAMKLPQQLEVQKLSPAKAIDHRGKGVTEQLAAQDKIFLEQPAIGDVTTITYKPKLSLKDGYKQTYILHANGYYEHIREFKNAPDIKFLSQFKSPGSMSKYGMELYQQTISQKYLAQKN